MKLVTGMLRAGTSFMTKAAMLSTRGYGVHRRQDPKTRYWLSEPSHLGRLLRKGDLKAIRHYIATLKQEFQPAGQREPILKHHFLIHYLPEVQNLFSSIVVCVRSPESWFQSARRHPATIRHGQRAWPWHEPDRDGEPLVNTLHFGQDFYRYITENIIPNLGPHATVFDFDLSSPVLTLEDFLSVPKLEAERLGSEFRGSRWA